MKCGLIFTKKSYIYWTHHVYKKVPRFFTSVQVNQWQEAAKLSKLSSQDDLPNVNHPLHKIAHRSPTIALRWRGLKHISKSLDIHQSMTAEKKVTFSFYNMDTAREQCPYCRDDCKGTAQKADEMKNNRRVSAKTELWHVLKCPLTKLQYCIIKKGRLRVQMCRVKSRL